MGHQQEIRECSLMECQCFRESVTSILRLDGRGKRFCWAVVPVSWSTWYCSPENSNCTMQLYQGTGLRDYARIIIILLILSLKCWSSYVFSSVRCISRVCISSSVSALHCFFFLASWELFLFGYVCNLCNLRHFYIRSASRWETFPILWELLLCTLVDGTNVTEKPAASFFRVEMLAAGSSEMLVSDRTSLSKLVQVSLLLICIEKVTSLKLGLANDSWLKFLVVFNSPSRQMLR
jgi:hypothetical protein